MRIDETHRRWFIGSVTGLLIATLVYAIYAARSPQGPHGGSVMGIIFGVLGYSFMIFAGLLGMRKKFPIWRIGRAQDWMRGHLWLGLLSFPLILFHSGLSFRGGALTSLLMGLFVLVIVSGILGAVLQHYMPRIITQQVPMETIYDQIDRVRGTLLGEADVLVSELSDPVKMQSIALQSDTEEIGAVSTVLRLELEATQELRDFFESLMRPYLMQVGKGVAPGNVLANAIESKQNFVRLRTLMPKVVHSSINDLEDICEEKRELDRQSKLHKFLHGWLMVHIPLSLALVILGLVHAIGALRY